MRIESPEVDPWIDRGSSQESLNLYRYNDGDPINKSDPDGLSPVPVTQPTTRPTTQPSAWERAAAAVDAGDWQAATDAMREARRNPAVGPSTGKVSNIDPARLRIAVTQLGRLNWISPNYPQHTQINGPIPGYPNFPGAAGKVSVDAGKNQAIGVVTRVQLKSDDGRDTGAYKLVAYNTSIQFRDGKPTSVDIDDRDFYGVFFHGTLNTSDGGNWYIDTPIAVQNFGVPTARFFQTHVVVEDSNGKIVPGVDAWYGWYWELDRDTGKVKWNIWPPDANKPYTDPKDHTDFYGPIPLDGAQGGGADFMR